MTGSLSNNADSKSDQRMSVAFAVDSDSLAVVLCQAADSTPSNSGGSFTGGTCSTRNNASDSNENDDQTVDAQKKVMQRRRSSRGSFFGRMGVVFRRAGGNDGADIDTIKGTTGADFESDVVIYRQSSVGLLASLFGLRKNRRNASRERHLIVKGHYCFVYTNSNDTSPKYALDLVRLTAKQQPQAGTMKRRKYVMVTLESSLGDVEYTVGLPDQQTASEFIATVEVQATAGEADMIRKELGHDGLVHKRSSMKYAEQVASVKTQKQPEKKPTTATKLDSALVDGSGIGALMVGGMP